MTLSAASSKSVRQTFIACPNQDVVYGLGFFSLDERPVVVWVPDFGDRFYVYAFYDCRTDQFGEIGSPYQSRPGHYPLVGPNWDGETPEGIVAAFRSPTPLGNSIPRIFMDDTDEDHAALQPLVNEAMVYPLEDYTGEMKTKDRSLLYDDDGSLTPYVGHRWPGSERGANWIPSPEGAFSLYLRAYWGQTAVTDGSWLPPVVARY
ncbi:MAG: DUF1254 domain-containing protein [Ornithinimicrobium sp.]